MEAASVQACGLGPETTDEALYYYGVRFSHTICIKIIRDEHTGYCKMFIRPSCTELITDDTGINTFILRVFPTGRRTSKPLSSCNTRYSSLRFGWGERERGKELGRRSRERRWGSRKIVIWAYGWWGWRWAKTCIAERMSICCSKGFLWKNWSLTSKALLTQQFYSPYWSCTT